MNAEQMERWRIVNAASARYFRLSLQGIPFTVIGTDGGLLETPRKETELLITPGERYDIVVGPFQEGEVFEIETLPYNRVTFVKSKRQKYAEVHVGEKKASVAFIPEKLREILPLVNRDAAIARSVKMSVEPSLKRVIDFTVNGELHGNEKPVIVGELQVWGSLQHQPDGPPFSPAWIFLSGVGREWRGASVQGVERHV
jgi:FtsP/CotA-like multicopper oxidase with cupredoxin domain